jgi:hypothetical protein
MFTRSPIIPRLSRGVHIASPYVHDHTTACAVPYRSRVHVTCAAAHVACV